MGPPDLRAARPEDLGAGLIGAGAATFTVYISITLSNRMGTTVLNSELNPTMSTTKRGAYSRGGQSPYP